MDYLKLALFACFVLGIAIGSEGCLQGGLDNLVNPDDGQAGGDTNADSPAADSPGKDPLSGDVPPKEPLSGSGSDGPSDGDGGSPGGDGDGSVDGQQPLGGPQEGEGGTGGDTPLSGDQEAGPGKEPLSLGVGPGDNEELKGAAGEKAGGNEPLSGQPGETKVAKPTAQVPGAGGPTPKPQRPGEGGPAAGEQELGFGGIAKTLAPIEGGDGGDGGTGGEATTTEPRCGNIVANTLGGGISLTRYDPTYYNGLNGGPVVLEGELDCDVDNPCCWQNAQPPVDQLEFTVGSGQISDERLKYAFNATSGPDGKFLIVASPCAEEELFEAQLLSCSIVCTQQSIRVSFMHWETNDVRLKVCLREAAFNDPESVPLTRCQEVPMGSSPGPFTASLPADSGVDVVIVASNFVNNGGDLAIVDNIRVDYVICPDEPVYVTTKPPTVGTTTLPTTEDYEYTDAVTLPPDYPDTTTPPAPTTADPTEECLAINCDFEKEANPLCLYFDGATNARLFRISGDKGGHVVRVGKTKVSILKWTVYEGRFRNYVTGIYKAGHNKRYAAVYLKKGEKAVLASTKVTFARNRVIRFMHYEATQGIQMRGCCDTQDNCPFVSNQNIGVDDRGWKTTNFICPKGTKEVFFTCENTGILQGACGLDYIQLYKAREDSASRQIEPLCPEGSLFTRE